jgi:NAD+ synthase (glutamine-hydrolysing)
MEILLHQTENIIGSFESKVNQLKQALDSTHDLSLHLYPELFLSGYNLQDLCLSKPFIKKYLTLLAEIENFFLAQKNPHFYALFGGLEYILNDDKSAPIKIYNVIYLLRAGEPLKIVHRKKLLPNYDIFDEQKYFTAGGADSIIKINGVNIALLICEDMWASSFYKVDPVSELKLFADANQIKIDLVVNLSASPYNLAKYPKRIKRAQDISLTLAAPFVYVNTVGAVDEIIFDGQSFVCHGSEILVKAKAFEIDQIKYYFNFLPLTPQTINHPNDSWEQLFKPQFDFSGKNMSLPQWSDADCLEVIKALGLGLQSYAHNNGFKKFLVALSGGLDSALVLCLIKLSLKENQSVEAIYMPSQYSSTLSYELSDQLCQNLDIPLRSFPIKFLHSVANNAFDQFISEPLSGLADENIQSRLRGLLIYTRSNQTGAMVVNTSNKSELAVGYSTQYGDSVGAISLLGDLYKSEIFQLAHFINRTFDNIIPEKIITRPPTAELREGQVDTDSLPPYPELDCILEAILSYQYDIDSLKKTGFSQATCEKVFNLYRKTEYKRYQFCPILKIKAKSFGFGYRIPISKKSDFYLN